MAAGRLHSVETFGSVDGPGVRFVIFLQGCPMRCRYCHNADTWDRSKGTVVTAAGLLDRAERCRSYWGDKGGITVSGGEPLWQPEFLLELLSEAKRRGINTCVDTSGQPFTRSEPFFSLFEQICKQTDLFLVDIKHIDDEACRRLTGHGNGHTLDLLRYLSEKQKPVWVRQVLVPGLTDDDGALRRTRSFIETLQNVERVEVLPYHSMGAYKWQELGLEYTLKDVQPPSKESVRNAEMILNGENPR